MREVIRTNKFKRDTKKCLKRGQSLDDLLDIVVLLANDIELDKKHYPHTLSGDYSGYWECHIRPDWLLIYELDDANNSLKLIRNGYTFWFILEGFYNSYIFQIDKTLFYHFPTTQALNPKAWKTWLIWVNPACWQRWIMVFSSSIFITFSMARRFWAISNSL